VINPSVRRVPPVAELSRNDQPDDELGSPPRIQHDVGQDETPSEALVTVLAELTGLAPTEMAPLYRFVDLEAIDTVLASTTDRAVMSGSFVLTTPYYDVLVDREEVVAACRDGSGPTRGG